MKIFSIIISMLLVFCLCFTSYASEIPEETTAPAGENEIVTRNMGDVDNDGNVNAGDARIVLRCAVALERLAIEDIIYADCDFNGRITASDARLVLRTAVALEDTVSTAFLITDMLDATCTVDGYITAKCQLTQKTVRMDINAYGHSLPFDAYCKEEVLCDRCKETILIEDPSHVFEYDYENNIRKCKRCGFFEAFEHKHSFSNGKCSCGKDAMTAFQKDITEYLKKQGVRGEGYYYVNEYIEPITFALFYEDGLGFSYAFCGFAVESNGNIFYYDFNYDFEDGTVEAVLYAEDTEVAYAYGKINPSKVDDAYEGDAITIEDYSAIPELNGMEKEFRQMMEGAVYDTVKWLRDYAERIGLSYVDYVFDDFLNVR